MNYSQDEKTQGMLAHILGLFIGVFGPLIIYLMKKDSSPYVEEHAKEALNFQISYIIYSFITGLLSMIIVGLLVLPVLILAFFILPIIAGVNANKGETYRYPLIFRFIK